MKYFLPHGTRSLTLLSMCCVVTLGGACTPVEVNQTNMVLPSTNSSSNNTTNQVPDSNTNVTANSGSDISSTKFFSTLDLGEIDPNLEFSAEIPSGWQVEYVPEITSINFFDPLAPGETDREKSQLFVRYFEASQFLTLQTVTIHARTESTINGRPVVTYEIEKKSGVADFPYQPSWRNQRHQVTDIRSTDENPSIFYVFGQRPGIDQSIVQTFLESISFEEQEALYYPIDSFTQQSTKKVFGTYITPATSPIQPEKFSGYHTGVDVEMTESQMLEDVAIFAVADGTISLKQQAQGYGGVLALEFTFQGQVMNAIYGHVRLSSIQAEVGEAVMAGEQLGVLGTGFSEETDGERKHLHFGLVPGTTPILLGYVASEDQLSGWIDPLSFSDQHLTLEP